MQAGTGQDGSSQPSARASHPPLHYQSVRRQLPDKNGQGKTELGQNEFSFRASEVPRRIRSRPSAGSMPGIAQGSVWVGVVALSQRSPAPAPGRLPRPGQALWCGKGTGLCSPVIQSLQEVRAQPRACSTSNGVAKHKPLEGSRRQVLKVKLSPRAGNVSPPLPPAESCQTGTELPVAAGSTDAAQTDPSSSRPSRPLLPTQWDLHLCTPRKVQQLLRNVQDSSHPEKDLE